MKKLLLTIIIIQIGCLSAISQTPPEILELKNWRIDKSDTMFFKVSSTKDSVLQQKIIHNFYKLDGYTLFVNKTISKTYLKEDKICFKLIYNEISISKKEKNFNIVNFSDNQDFFPIEKLSIDIPENGYIVKKIYLKKTTDNKYYFDTSAKNIVIIIPEKVFTSSEKHTITHLKSKLNNQIRYSRNLTRFVLGIQCIPSMSYRQVVVGNPQFVHNSELARRNAAETMNFGYSIGLTLGIANKGHLVYGELLSTKQGFYGSTIDWNNGYIKNDNTTSFQFYSLGGAIGYSYRPYTGMVKPYTDLAFYFMGRIPNKSSDEMIKGTNSFKSGVKVGLGISYKPCYLMELRLGPSIIYNFSLAQRADLNTHLYNVGANIGVLFHIGKKLDRLTSNNNSDNFQNKDLSGKQSTSKSSILDDSPCKELINVNSSNNNKKN